MKIHVIVMLLTAGMLVAGCGKSAGSKAADVYLAGMNDIASAVEKVDDEKSAEKAAEVIARVTAEMEEVSDTLEGMSDSEQKELEEKYAEDFAKAQARITAAMTRLITKPHLMLIISKEMQNMPDMR